MNTLIKKYRKFRRGSILAFVVLIGVVLALLGAAMLQMGFGARLNSSLSVFAITAREAADAGISDALYKMNAALNFDGTINPALWPPDVTGVPLANSNANYSYTITGPFPNPVGPYPYWEITSIGNVSQQDRKSHTVHVRSMREPFWFGVGVKENFDLYGDGIFESYPPGTEFEGSVRTNSIENDAITLHSDTIIPGDVAIGPDGDTTYAIKTPSDTATIEGDSYASLNYLDFPDAELPVAPWIPGPVLTFNTVTTPDGHTISRAILPTGAYQYNNLYITPISGTEWTEVVTTGNVLINVVNDMRISNGCKLVIGDMDVITGPDLLRVYLGRSIPQNEADRSSFIAENGSGIVTLPRIIDGAPEPYPHAVDFRIYGLPSCKSTGQNPAITLHNSSEFWGVIYAPEARILINNSSNVYGSFIGKSMEIHNSGAFYYDTRIPGEYNEGPYFFGLSRWWEVAGS